MLLSAKSMLDAANKLEGFSIKDVTKALLKQTDAQDIGTVWRPLESIPYITVYY